MRRSGGATQYIVGTAASNILARKVGWLSNAALSVGTLRKPRMVCHSCMLGMSPAKLPDLLVPGCPLTILATVTRAEEVRARTASLQTLRLLKRGSAYLDSSRLHTGAKVVRRCRRLLQCVASMCRALTTPLPFTCSICTLCFEALTAALATL